MTQDEFVEQILHAAKENHSSYWQQLPDHMRLRLFGLEQENRALIQKVTQGLWQLSVTALEKQAEQEASYCSCGKRCEKHRTKKRIKIDLLGLTIVVLCIYYYCRGCRKGDSPVWRWLGVQDGGVSLTLERATTDLSSQLTFGDTVRTLAEQHGQVMDRTKAERITYRAGEDAEIYLGQRRQRVLAALGKEGRTVGVEQLQLTADGGAIPVGTLKRPSRDEITQETPLTPVRQIPKGTRTIQGREARFISVRQPESKTERIVDCHIAPYNQTEVSGERMLAAAAEAGLRDNTNIHGVFDMGRWIHGQFEAQFAHYPHSAVADIMHVATYLTDAGRVLVGEAQAHGFGQEKKRQLLDGEPDSVLKELEAHHCNGHCKTDEQGCCLVVAAARYLRNNRRYLNYPPVLERGLPVGSGEAESGIRHSIKKREDVAGAWREDHANEVLALITIRESGWWDDFWSWRDRRDLELWHRRQRREIRPQFRGKPERPPAPECLLVN